MSTHLSRKDLKNDALAHEVEVGVEYVATHKSQVTKYAAAVIVILLAVGGYMLYRDRQAKARAEAYSEARKVMAATVGASSGSGLSFATEEEKTKAVEAAYSKIASDYPGTVEGAIAKLYLAAGKMDRGETDAAVPIYREVIDQGPKPFDSTAKLALAQILWGQGKADEGKKMLEDLVANPSDFVSSDQAKLVLARLQLQSNPAEARKLLDELSKSRAAISSAAVEMMVQLPQN